VTSEQWATLQGWFRELASGAYRARGEIERLVFTMLDARHEVQHLNMSDGAPDGPGWRPVGGYAITVGTGAKAVVERWTIWARAVRS
jgi:hypothetical protein